MCNKTGIAFAERTLTPSIVVGRDVIEVGAYDVNGSVRPYVESLAPSSYLGVDIAPGPRVDRVLDARELVGQLGGDSADIVITTEMLEHVRDWHTVVTNLKAVLRPGGYLLVTTRSAGFPYNAWPYDFCIEALRQPRFARANSDRENIAQGDAGLTSSWDRSIRANSRRPPAPTRKGPRYPSRITRTSEGSAESP
jgi:SAM-dependent methyltransferase